MTKLIRSSRVALALSNIGAWRTSVNSQGATHLLPMLALVERNAASPTNTPVVMNERPDEYDFWDKYFYLDDDIKGKPYFNPVTLRRAEEDFPHSNSATVRKNTFAGKWFAASREKQDKDEVWKLSDDYADIFREKVLSKGQKITRVPVLDLSAIMFRSEVFDDTAEARTLESKFRQQFPMRDADYEKIFAFHPEDSANIFEDSSIVQDYKTAIKASLVPDVKTAEEIPLPITAPNIMDLEDPILVQVQQLLTLGTSGIIFTGSPGTGKSYYAGQVAKHLAMDARKDIFRVQFHPSYGYEDFVEGYRPDQKSISGFCIVPKTFLAACRRAEELKKDNGLAILIVDEINRGDPARVFGELLTYIERPYRGIEFILPFSGTPCVIPDNLILLGTMNPYDRSIAQVDAAFARRFDHIEVAPSREVAEQLLDVSGGFTAAHISIIGEWFDSLQRIVPNGIGHSFFADVKNLEHLKVVWRYRMRPAAEHAIAMNDGTAGTLANSFDALVRRIEGVPDDA